MSITLQAISSKLLMTLLGPDLHLHAAELLEARMNVPCGVSSIEIRLVAFVVSPCSFMLLCAATAVLVIVLVICAELHSTVVGHGIMFTAALPPSNGQSILVSCTSYLEGLILNPFFLLVFITMSIRSSTSSRAVRQWRFLSPYQNSPLRSPKPFS